MFIYIWSSCKELAPILISQLYTKQTLIALFQDYISVF